MILNVSGRCDIVAFYSEWFLERYERGFVDVRNPIYPKLISRIYFKDVDLIVFCTKNPLPIIDKLYLINIPILFQITLTPYKEDIELVPPKGLIIEGIKKISNIIGQENVYVRYDPIFLSKRYNLQYHINAFDNLCSKLDGYVNKIIISFMDEYKNTLKNKKYLKYQKLREDDIKTIGKKFQESATKHHITVQTCSEENSLIEYSFIKDDCVSKELAFQKTGKKFAKWYSRNNKYCNCVAMTDIGVYNCCKHLCKYCYANFDESKVGNNFKIHDKNSSLLIGHLQADDIVKIKK